TTADRWYAVMARPRMAAATRAIAHQGNGYANVTSGLRHRERAEVLIHGAAVRVWRGVVRTARQPVFERTLQQLLRQRGLEALEVESYFTVQDVPLGEVLLECFGSGRRIDHQLTFRRR